MIVIGADTHKGSHALAAVDEGTGRVRGSREIGLTMRGTWPRFGGLVVWTRTGCGRSRTAGMCRGGSSRHCWRRASGSSAWRLIGWAPPGRGSASRASRIRSTRLRSPVRSSETASSSSRSRIWMTGRWRSACSTTTEATLSPSARGRQTGCAGICWRCAPTSSGRSNAARSTKLACWTGSTGRCVHRSSSAATRRRVPGFAGIEACADLARAIAFVLPTARTALLQRHERDRQCGRLADDRLSDQSSHAPSTRSRGPSVRER